MFSIIDIETTGGNARMDRITEIAIYIHDGEKVVDSYATLINPERSIPYFITSITGIDDDMVRDAPRFFEIARKIVELTENTIFIAHNVSFDYGFIREEFRRLGFDFKRKKLCTVQLSRKLFPGMKSYSLGKICQTLSIEINGRHRAAGDALATVKLFDKLISKDNNNLIHANFDNAVKSYSIPIHIHNELIDPLPEDPGVYYFLDDEDNLLYIGKSKNIRSRIVNHFNNTRTKKAIEMRERIKRIDFECTGSELIALLKESDEIKTHLPFYNRAQRRKLFNYGIYTSLELDGYIHLSARKIGRNSAPFVSFSSLAEAKNTLRRMCDDFELCLKLSGLYKTETDCFYHQIGQCRGACIGDEKPETYNLRVEEALNKYKFEHQNFIVIDYGRKADENSIILVKNGKYCGFGYMNSNQQLNGPEDAFLYIQEKEDNRETGQIIRNYLKKNKVVKLIRY